MPPRVSEFRRPDWEPLFRRIGPGKPVQRNMGRYGSLAGTTTGAAAMRRAWNRRQVLAGLGLSAIAAGGPLRSPASAKGGPSERLDLAIVGCGGQGSANLDQVAGENIVALCDVDDERAADAFKRF